MGRAGIKTAMPIPIKITIKIADRISLNIFYQGVILYPIWLNNKFNNQNINMYIGSSIKSCFHTGCFNFQSLNLLRSLAPIFLSAFFVRYSTAFSWKSFIQTNGFVKSLSIFICDSICRLILRWQYPRLLRP